MSFLVLGLGLFSLTVMGQRVVQVPTNEELSTVILGDTLENGERVDVNTVYELERDGLYPVAKELSLQCKTENGALHRIMQWHF